MKTLPALLFAVLCSVFFYSCDESPIIHRYQSFDGNWTVDKVQIVSAPNTGTASAIMKQALAAYGEIDASFAGYLDINFRAVTMTTSPTNLNIPYRADMTFIANTGFAYDYANRNVKLTTDGGISWASYPLPESATTDITPLAVVHVNANIIYYIGKNSSNSYTLHKSTNKGANWNAVNTALPFSAISSPYFNSSVKFLHEYYGYAIGKDAGSNTHLYRTTNRGESWENIYNNAEGMYGLNFIDAYNGYSRRVDASSNYYFMRTIDGGISWQSFPLPAGVGLSGQVYFKDLETGWINGEKGFFSTTNGGASWKKESITKLDNFAYEIYDSFSGIIGSAMVWSYDGGANWIPYAAPTDARAIQVKKVNNEVLFFSDNNTILKSGNSDNTKWVAKGKITNPLLQIITGAEDKESFANGEYSSGTEDNSVSFTTANYSEGNNIASGGGTYYVDVNSVYFTLNLPNNEVWKIKLKRK